MDVRGAPRPAKGDCTQVLPACSLPERRPEGPPYPLTCNERGGLGVGAPKGMGVGTVGRRRETSGVTASQPPPLSPLQHACVCVPPRTCRPPPNTSPLRTVRALRT